MLETILSSLGRRRGYLAALAEQLKAHDLGDTEMSFEVARLVIALRAAGADLPAPICQSCGKPTGPGASTTGSRIRCHACVRLCPSAAAPAALKGKGPADGAAENARGTAAHVSTAPDRTRPATPPADATPARRRLPAAALTADRPTATGSPGPASPGSAGSVRCAEPSTECCRPRPAERFNCSGPRFSTAEPLTTRRWITRPEIADCITELAASRIPLTHDLLDAQPLSGGLDHLRDLLVAAGASCRSRTRTISRFELDAQRMLAVLLPTHARLVAAGYVGRCCPTSTRPTARVDLIQATTNARRTLRQVMAFVSTLEHAGTSLHGCSQRQIDDWFATSSALRHQVRPFLSWMQRTNHLSRDLTLPGVLPRTPERRTDSEERWRIARRLVTDETLDPADRVAGALVVLYAQPLGRVVALTTGHVGHDGEGVTLRLGTDLLDLAEPFANLVQSLPRRRRKA